MKVIVGKVVVMGHQGVGKTSTVMRYLEHTFSDTIAPTIGATFFNCKVTVGEVNVKLQIWDTAGQERFKAMAPMFYRNSNGAILVFDITDYRTFESMKNWVLELHRNVEASMVLCVVGNKLDLAHKREVNKGEALQYAKSINASYFECSAKDDTGLGLIFDNIAVGLCNMAGHGNHTLKVYNSIDDLMARSSELEPTDEGNEETVNVSIKSIAHGNSVNSKCC